MAPHAIVLGSHTKMAGNGNSLTCVSSSMLQEWAAKKEQIQSGSNRRSFHTHPENLLCSFEQGICRNSHHKHDVPPLAPSRSLIFVAVFDAAENIALNLHLFGALDKSLLALPINIVDVFLHGAESDFLCICPNLTHMVANNNVWQQLADGLIDNICDGFCLPNLRFYGCMA